MTKGQFAIVSFCLAWCATAWARPSSLNSDPLIIQKILLLMGLVYLATGIWTYRARTNATTSLFLLYCSLAAVHWAGPIEIGYTVGDRLLLGIYVVLAAALFEGLFLHLSVSFPKAQLRKKALSVIYAPTALGTLLVIVTLIYNLDQNLLLMIYYAGNLYGIVAGLIWIIRSSTGKIAGMNQCTGFLISVVVVFAWLPNFLASNGVIDLRSYQGLSNLSLVALLFTLSWIFRKFSEPNASDSNSSRDKLTSFV